MTAKASIKKKKVKDLEIADFWCGAGGSTTGAVEALREFGLTAQFTGVNHWEIAVATHSRNHPTARHFQKSVDSLSPLDLFPNRRLYLLMASPECTHHSNARGGKPRDEQKRADANDIKRWVEKLYIENILIENVKEFIKWGPLNAKGQPIKKLAGTYFNSFVDFLKITYNVEWRILNCADYGDATTRERFFLIARRKTLRKPIVFPAPTHTHRNKIKQTKESIQPSFFNTKTLQPWKPAREIIDWNLKGESIFLTPEDVRERKLRIKRPLSDNTMKRIIAGLFKYSLNPLILSDNYLVNLKNKDRRDRSIDEPTFTQCGANHQYLIELEKYMIQFFGENGKQKERVRQLTEPLWTVTGQGRMAIAEPFVISHFGNQNEESRVKSTDEPLTTITAQGNVLSVAEPFIVSLANTGKTNIESKDKRIYELERPLPTITGKNFLGLLQPFLTKFYAGSDACSIDEPLPTVTSNFEHLGVCSPYLVKMKNNQDGQTIDEPIGTLTTKESYALVIPKLGIALDILFRMLQPHELAAATSFPKSYSFAGNRQAQVKQIGNAVPVKTAKALVLSILEN